MKNVKESFLCFWDLVDTPFYLIVAAFMGGAISWNLALTHNDNERANWAQERASLVARIRDVRSEEEAQCIKNIDGVRSDYRDRANEWKDRIDGLTTEVGAANDLAAQCQAAMGKVIASANKTQNSAAVAANQATKAADAATAEHVQQQLIRKYGK